MLGEKNSPTVLMIRLHALVSSRCVPALPRASAPAVAPESLAPAWAQRSL